MQPRKLKSKWQLLGGYKGGAGTSNVERDQKKPDEKESEDSSSDEETNRGGFHTDDEGLDYGSEDSDLSNRLDEELQRVEADEIEETELSLPAQGWTGCSDEIDAVEEGGDQKLARVEGKEQVVRCDDKMDLGEVPAVGAVGDSPVEISSSEDRNSRTFADGSRGKEVEGEPECMETSAAGIDLDDNPAHQVEDGDDDAGEEGGEANSGARFLEQIDKDFLCSPRQIVRGVYRGKDIVLIVRRRVEGNFVDWSIFNTKTNLQALLVHCQMTYPYGLSREALSTKFGHEVLGGWNWRGWGYGYLNLNRISESFPHDPRVLHVDLEEAVFFDHEIFHHYHLSGEQCVNLDKSEDVNCQEDGCGLRIWSIMMTTFTTAEAERKEYQPQSFRKEKKEQVLYLSMVAFFNGETKIVIHQEMRLKRSQEEVVWLTKDEKAEYHDSVAAVDRVKLQRAEQVWETRVPKPGFGGDTLTAKVSWKIEPLIQRSRVVRLFVIFVWSLVV